MCGHGIAEYSTTGQTGQHSSAKCPGRRGLAAFLYLRTSHLKIWTLSSSQACQHHLLKSNCTFPQSKDFCGKLPSLHICSDVSFKWHSQALRLKWSSRQQRNVMDFSAPLNQTIHWLLYILPPNQQDLITLCVPCMAPQHKHSLYMFRCCFCFFFFFFWISFDILNIEMHT